MQKVLKSVQQCMHLSSDAQHLRSEHTNTKRVAWIQMSIEQQLSQSASTFTLIARGARLKLF